VEVADDASIDIGTSDFSISAWVSVDDTSQIRTILTKSSGWRAGQPTQGFYFGVHSTGVIRFEFRDGSTRYDNFGTQILDTGKVYYIIAGRSGGDAFFYIDGKADTVATSNSYSGDLSNAISLRIGYDGHAPRMYDGKISSPKIFDVALTLAQIQEMYLNPEQILPTGVASSNLKLWLPLQEGSGTTNYDGSGNNNDGTISGATWVKAETDIAQTALIRSNYTSSVFYPEGLTAGQDIQGTTLANTDENVLTLNGAEVVNVDNILTQIGTDTSGSIEAWVKPRDGQPSAIESMFGFGDTNAVEHLEVWNNTDGKVRALTVDAGTTQWVVETDSAIWANGESTWKHIVLVQNGTAPIIYVDGVAPAQTFSTSTDKTTWFSDLAGVDNARIGCRNYNSAGNSTIYNGSIDDVRIYSDALSATEVTKNYNAGLSKHRN
jgi:hypothetical protein